jgi:2-(1,2-epoxy-1,2-dihydrophenyl)acetyl-CoA isomerase
LAWILGSLIPNSTDKLLQFINQNALPAINAFSKAISQDHLENWLRTAIGHFNSAISQLRNLDAAIVVGVQGASAGGALGLIWCANHVILSEDASISMAYAKLGGSPDGGTSWLLPRLVNPLRAFEMFTLMSSLKAKQALDWGFPSLSYVGCKVCVS